MQFKKTTYDGGFDAIWRGEAKMLPGGFLLKDDIPADAVICRGTPIVVDFSDLSCTLAKSATVLEGGTTTAIRVAKGHLFAVGDKLTVADDTDNGDTGGNTGDEGGGGNTATVANVTAIDTSATDYDTITVDTALDGTEVYTPACVPNAVVGAVFNAKGKDEKVLDAAYDCLVMYPATALPIVDAWKDGIHLAGNHKILLIRQ